VEPIEVAVDVLLDLAFGLDKEPHAPAVAGQARGHAQGERTGIPEGRQQAGARIELAKALRAPSEVVPLLRTGMLQRGAHRLVPGHEGLPGIEGLRANLARVVDPHQPGHMAACFAVRRPGTGLARRRP